MTARTPPGDGLSAGALRRLFELGAAQIGAALGEADAAATRLSELLAKLQQGGAASDLADALCALQFYDKLVQRLTHVQQGLELAAGQLEDPQRPPGPAEEALYERIQALYSMVEERVLFDFVVRGRHGMQMLRALGALRAANAPGELETF